MRPTVKKWLWFVAFWAVGVLAVTLVGGVIRLFLA